MACSRGILKRVNHFRRGFYPSCGNLIGNNKHDTETASQNPGSMIHIVLPHNGMNSVFRERQYGSLAGPVGFGFSSCRYMSSTPTKWSVKVNFDVKEVIPDDGTIEAVASHVPAMNEVAVAASDSVFPVAALQYLIDGVHSFTGLNWWSSIVLTTVMIHGLTLPVLLYLHKAASKLKDMLLLSTVLTGLTIHGTIILSFFFALKNMAEKVPSFKSGGTLWFTDLSIPDSSYVLPLLTAITLLIGVECIMQDGLEWDPVAESMRKFSRILAFASVPVMMSFETALFCYGLTYHMFYLVGYVLVLKRPMVKRLSNIPPSGKGECNSR